MPTTNMMTIIANGGKGAGFMPAGTYLAVLHTIPNAATRLNRLAKRMNDKAWQMISIDRKVS